MSDQSTKDLLDELHTFFVRQKRDWLEVFTGLEQKNRFSITDEKGVEILFAGEEGSNPLTRILLGRHRPYTVRVITPDKRTYLKLRAPFKFFFFELNIHDQTDQHLGKIVRKFSFMHPRYKVYDAAGVELFDIKRNLIEIWTYRIFRGNFPVGIILKKWKGLATEFFSDADSFKVQFSQSLPLAHRKLLLGSLFLTDKDYFEGNSGSVLGTVVDSVS